jgi:hypothetical protein
VTGAEATALAVPKWITDRAMRTRPRPPRPVAQPAREPRLPESVTPSSSGVGVVDLGGDGLAVVTVAGTLSHRNIGTEIPVDPWVVDWLVDLLRGRTTGKFIEFEASRSGGRMSQRPCGTVSTPRCPSSAGNRQSWCSGARRIDQQMGFHSLRHLEVPPHCWRADYQLPAGVG